MSKAIEILYHKTIVDTIKAITSTLADAYEDANTNRSNEDFAQLIETYTSLLETYSDEIYRAIGQDINQYINYYRVKCKASIDEFKAIYFSCRVLSRFMERDGLSDLRLLVDRCSVRLLSFRLELGLQVNRGAMDASLLKIVDENDTEKFLGKHGMYLMYKCVYNAVKSERDKGERTDM